MKQTLIPQAFQALDSGCFYIVYKGTAEVVSGPFAKQADAIQALNSRYAIGRHSEYSVVQA